MSVGNGLEADLAAMRAAELERFRNGPVMAYINAGHTRFEAAAHFNLKQHVVDRIVRLVTQKKADPYDKPSRVRERERALEAQRAREAQLAERVEMIRTLYAQDVTSGEIGKRLGIHRNRVTRIARAHGIPIPVPHHCRPDYVNPNRPPRDPNRKRASSPTRVNHSFKRTHQIKTRTEVEDMISDRRSKISGLITADRNNRKPPPITLPRVSILEGVID